MACGQGMSAVRTLSGKLAVRSTTTMGSERQELNAVPDSCDSPKLAAIQPSQQAPAYTTRSLDERLLEGVIYSDNEQYGSDDFGADDASEPEQAGVRARSLPLRELPDPLEFMDPKWMRTFTKLFGEDNNTQNSDSDFDAASDADASSEKNAEEDVESDCEEMYSGPLQPKRTSAHRDFPSPSEYLTKEELMLARKFYR
eukprot:TRINITY_DN21576_c1_g1_i4.p1 TRINITY_DN21576_c1_g1~~TRINITY_DN21576_c1_g1_i4.p1  ORF type:complete len:199 (-),score=40.37 TRINITY_DN21576_c1_g1_i4:321-917(-)